MTPLGVEGRPGGSPAVPLAAARPLRRPGCALRLAGVGAEDTDALHRRDRVHAALPLDRRAPAARRSAAARRRPTSRSTPTSLRRPGGSTTSRRRTGAIKVIGVLAMTAARLPRLRARTARRLATLGALRGGRRRWSLPRSPTRRSSRRAARLPGLDAGALADRAGRDPSEPRLDRARARGLRSSRSASATQLAILLPVLALVLLARAWRSERSRRWRTTWTAWDWVGAVTLLVGVAVAVSAVLGQRSVSWYVATGFFKSRMLEYGLWALGALADRHRHPPAHRRR